MQIASHLARAEEPPRALEAELDRVVHGLVLGNRSRLFPDGADAVDILSVELGPPRGRRWGSFHRVVTVSYRCRGRVDAIPVWLKFLPGIDTDALFRLLLELDERLAGNVFPRPYFAWRSYDGEAAFLATEMVGGGLLRDRLLRLAALRRTAELEPVLHSNGAKMRRFHDALAPSGCLPVSEVIASVTKLVRTTAYLSPAERDATLAQIERRRDLLRATALPAIRTHYDWTLRNILVTPQGDDRVIDTGGFRHRANWRWYDPALLLLNLEAQLKWAPLTTRAMLSRLWQAFWRGYMEAGALPDGLTEAELPAVLYLVRLDWLLGGVVKQPYFELAGRNGILGARLRRRLAATAASGEPSLIETRAIKERGDGRVGRW